MHRPKRNVDKPNYADDNNKEQIEDATDSESGEESDAADPEFGEAQARQAAAQEQAEDEEAEQEGDDASDGESDNECADDGYNSADTDLAGDAADRRPRKSVEELQAEETLAGKLNLTYPEQFRAMRRNVSYLYACIAGDLTPKQAVRMAYDRIAFPEPIEPAERDQIIAEAVRLARDITMPNEVVQEVFAELSKHNGGRLVTAARHITTLFAIVCMVRQVVKLPEYKRAGSVQALGFAILVDVFGEGFSNGAGDGQFDLGNEYVTDTPLDSAMAHGRADVVDRFEAMENKLEVLGLLFGTLANLGDDAAGQAVQDALRSASRPKYDRSRYDKTPVKGARAICHENGLTKIALHVVQRQGAPDYTDRGVAALAAQYGSVATPFHTAYPPCDRLREPLPKLTSEQESDAFRSAWVRDQQGYQAVDEQVYARERARFAMENRVAREAEAPRRLVVTHRNERTVLTPDGNALGADSLMGALRGLVEDEGTKLHAHLAQAVPTLKQRGFKFAGEDVYLAAYKDGKRVRFGKSKKGARNSDLTLEGRKFQSMPAGKWLSLEFAHREEVEDAVLQPWLAFTPGVWDFYLLVGSMPKDDVLEFNKLRQRLRDEHIENKVALTRQIRESDWRARKATRPGTKKRKLNPAEERELERYLNEKESLAIWSAQCDKAYTDIAKKKARVVYPHKPGVYPADHPVMAAYYTRDLVPQGHVGYHYREAELRREQVDRRNERAAAMSARQAWNKKAMEWFRGCEQHAHAMAAHPEHGADVAQAEASFAANATA